MSNIYNLSREEAKTKMVFEVLPKMADIHDRLRILSLEEARRLLQEQVGTDWIEKSVALIGIERLKEVRPSWYQTFVVGENGEIGHDEMSKLIEKYMPKEQAIMEIAFYMALNETGLYNYYLNQRLDYDAIHFTVSTDEGIHQKTTKVEKGSIPGYEWFSPENPNVTIADAFKMLGHMREKMIRVAEGVRDALNNGTLLKD